MSRRVQLKDVRGVIVASLRRGITRQCAAELVGITDRTLRNWVRRGRETGREPYASFAVEVAQAEANVEQALTGSILRAALEKHDWRAAQLWLERRREAWRPRTHVNVEGAIQQVFDVVESVCGPEAAERVIEAIAAEDSAEEAR